MESFEDEEEEEEEEPTKSEIVTKLLNDAEFDLEVATLFVWLRLSRIISVNSETTP